MNKESILEGELLPGNYLTGKLLVSSPFMDDPSFLKTVVFICGHDKGGAIGIIINKPFLSLSFEDFFRQLNISTSDDIQGKTICYGGPVEVSRGFVLHSNDYAIDSTVRVGEHFSVTSTVDVLKAIVEGGGPENELIALGYSGWRSGELEKEIQDNHWFVAEATKHLLFETPIELKWKLAFKHMGIDHLIHLSLDGGQA